MFEYAPILIPTLNRIDHLKKCLESLQVNSFAKETELFISVDYPPNAKYQEGYYRVKEYLGDGIEGFKEVHIFFQEKNLGAFSNARFLREQIRGLYSKYIFTEDDNVFSSNYLEYMNLCLEKYKDREDVIAISGYMWPLEIESDDSVTTFSSIFSAWGYGTWFSKFDGFITNISFDRFKTFINDRKSVIALSKKNPFIFAEMIKGYFEYSGCLVMEEHVQEIDLAYSICMFFMHKKMIYPITSKVRNGGNDGSGEHCVYLRNEGKKEITNRNYEYWSQIIDTDKTFRINDDSLFAVNTIEDELTKFLIVSKSELFKCWLLYFLYSFRGRTRTVSFVKKIKK